MSGPTIESLQADLCEALAYIERLRGPLLWYFGTTDPDLLIEQWKESKAEIETGENWNDGFGPIASRDPRAARARDPMSERCQTLSVESVRRRLTAAVERAGSQRAYAKTTGVSAAYINDVLHGRREPGESILRPLGIERDVRYVVRYFAARPTPTQRGDEGR